MGGDRETTVAARVGTDLIVGDLRVHEKKGEVHFHADKDGLKVAVPVNRWYAAWAELRLELGCRRFYDIKTNCVLTVHTFDIAPGQVQSSDNPLLLGTIKVELSIQKVEITLDFANIDKFTNG